VVVRPPATARPFCTARVGLCICRPREPPLCAVEGADGGRRAPDATVEGVGPGCAGLLPPGLLPRQESQGDSPRGEADAGATVGAAAARMAAERGWGAEERSGQAVRVPHQTPARAAGRKRLLRPERPYLLREYLEKGGARNMRPQEADCTATDATGAGSAVHLSLIRPKSTRTKPQRRDK